MARLRHLFSFAAVRRSFPPTAMDAIRQAIAASEATHEGEIVFAVEAGLGLRGLLRQVSPRERADEVFARLRVWDTERNCGVLIYLLLAERAIEIVADRGAAARIDAEQWQPICARMRERFLVDDFEGGALAGVAAVGALLQQHFPSIGRSPRDELPNRPVWL